MVLYLSHLLINDIHGVIVISLSVLFVLVETSLNRSWIGWSLNFTWSYLLSSLTVSTYTSVCQKLLTWINVLEENSIASSIKFDKQWWCDYWNLFLLFIEISGRNTIFSYRKVGFSEIFNNCFNFIFLKNYWSVV